MWQRYGQEKVSKEFEVNREKENSTCFTNIISVQKLEIILVIKWLNEMTTNWVERCFIGIRMIW